MVRLSPWLNRWSETGLTIMKLAIPLITSLTLPTSHNQVGPELGSCATGGTLSHSILHITPERTILGRKITPTLDGRKLGLRGIQQLA